MKLLDDIISLKKKHNLLEEDATDEKMYSWYEYLISKGLVEYEYDNDKLIGFMEYVRLPEVPKDMNNIELNYDTINTAPVLLVCNCIAEKKGVIWKLRRRILEKNKVDVFCWHRKRGDIIKSFNNIKSGAKEYAF